MAIWTGIGIGLVITLAIFGWAALSVFIRRGRTKTIREREIPPFDAWRERHYPKASKEESEVVRRALQTLAEGFADVEPTQLRPDDPLEDFVLDRRPQYRALALDDDWSLLLGELAISAPRELPDLAPWEVVADNCWETVGDVIDFLLKRLRSPDDKPVAAATKGRSP